ncbi:MAG: tRNA lysidine(34) synthetase TilS [Planctomycetaceae bacterium]
MHAFLVKLEAACRRLDLGNQRLLLAVSGGADSVALLRGMVDLQSSLSIGLHVAHLNHALRAAAADDAQWLAALCERLGVSLTQGRFDVAAAARDAGLGIEEAARAARYEFLKQTAATSGCDAVAVAHHADDQAETILHHILRGTGLAGLRGMQEARALDANVRLVRPMLEISRAEIVDYLRTLDQPYRLDESNADEAYTRNRMRHSLLPLLERDFNPQLREALRRLGQQAAEAEIALDICVEGFLDRALESQSPHDCRLKWQALPNESRHLVRAILAALWQRMGWPRQAMTFDHWDRLARVALTGGAADFPGGVHARREGRLCHIAHR